MTRAQWEDCKVCGGDHWTKDHPGDRCPDCGHWGVHTSACLRRPPVGYWCCADDWNAGTFRTGECIGRTQGPAPEWVRIQASDSPEKPT